MELVIRNLTKQYPNKLAVDGVNLTLRPGVYGLLGANGAGKTTLMRMLCGILHPTGGEITLDGLTVDQEDYRASLGYLPQDFGYYPGFTGMDFLLYLGALKGLPRPQAKARAAELLSLVDIPNPDVRLKDYPFQFSGGMQQRAMIAMGMSCNPDILICDEPTTALDVTVQAQVLEQLNQLRERFGTALIIITHNLGIVARYADTVKIMYGGKIVEDGPTDEVFENPQHPYTLGLIRAVPRLDLPRSHGLYTIEGEPPDMSKIPPDCCAFHSRCKYADELCRSCRPQPEQVGERHWCACFHRELAQAEREEVLSI